MTEQTPRIYCACLSAYNNGKLHGTWIDCDRDVDFIWEEIKKMLASSPEPEAEEWALHDFENWQGIKIGEYESIERVAEIAELLIEHGKAFAAYYGYYGEEATAESFTDSYLGEYESEEDFVRGQWQDDGRLKELEKLGISDHWIDWEAIARDWFIDSYYSVNVSYKEVYVFSRH